MLFRLTLLFTKLSIKTYLEQFLILRNGLKVNDANMLVGGFLSMKQTTTTNYYDKISKIGSLVPKKVLSASES